MRIDEVIQQPGMVERLLKQNIMRDMHVAIPGEVVSYDTNKKTATIQPTIRDWESSENPPLLLDVPVFMWGSFTFTPQPGDGCLVVCADSCVDSWLQNKGVNTPIVDRNHSLSDGFALVGFNVENGTDLHEALENAESRMLTKIVTASSLEQLKSRLITLMKDVPLDYTVDVRIGVTQNFDVFIAGSPHLFTFVKITANVFKGYGQVNDTLVAITRNGDAWEIVRADKIKQITSGDLATIPDGDYMIASSDLSNVSNKPANHNAGLFVKVRSFESGYRIYEATYYTGYLPSYKGSMSPGATNIGWYAQMNMSFVEWTSGNLNNALIPSLVVFSQGNSGNIQNSPFYNNATLVVTIGESTNAIQFAVARTASDIALFAYRTKVGTSWSPWFFVRGLTSDSATKVTNSAWTTGNINLRKSGNVVHLKMEGIKINALTQRTTIGTLPAGYRPWTETYFIASDGSRKWMVDADGNIKGETQSAGQLWATVVYLVP